MRLYRSKEGLERITPVAVQMALDESLLAALFGAVAAIGVRELVVWIRLPRFAADFESFGGKKPYFHQLTLLRPPLPSGLARFLRVTVFNIGGSAARDCEAKLEVWRKGELDPVVAILHWARRDPGIYSSLDAIYTPVTINKGGQEALDLLVLEKGSPVIRSESPRRYEFDPKVPYTLRVTISGSNTSPLSFVFFLQWDGSWDRFDQSVQIPRDSGSW